MKTQKKHIYVALANHGNHTGYNRIWQLTKCESLKIANKLKNDLFEQYQDDRYVTIMDSDDIMYCMQYENRIIGDIEYFNKNYSLCDGITSEEIEKDLNYYETFEFLKLLKKTDKMKDVKNTSYIIVNNLN